MNNWKKHTDMIKRYCEVKAETDKAIWFFDGDSGICEFKAGASFSCSNMQDFEELCEMFNNEDFAE